MARPERVDTLDDVKVWIADHDGYITAWWQQQREWNDRVDRKISSVNTRLTSVEKRIIYVAGAASAFGSGLGYLILRLAGGGG